MRKTTSGSVFTREKTKHVFLSHRELLFATLAPLFATTAVALLYVIATCGSLFFSKIRMMVSRSARQIR